MADLPGDITDPERIDPTKRVEKHEPSQTPSKEDFSSYMKDDSASKGPANVTNQPSPMDIAAQKTAMGQPPSMNSIQDQMHAASGFLGDLKNQLHTKGLKLKHSQKYLIRNKLQSAHENIRSAAKKMGVDTGPPLKLQGSKNPVVRFLNMVSDGQYQLNNAAKQVRDIDTSGKSLNTGDLLLVQVKLQKAQQELEYTSVILGKSIEMLKTVFNTQI